jgi:hypothetical protein
MKGFRCCFAFAALTILAGPAFCQQLVGQRVVQDDFPTVVERTIVVEGEVDVSVAGQVVRTKQVDVRGSDTKILVALLDVGDGRRQIVDLGPTDIYRNSPIYTGDQIAVRGPRVVLGKASVLLAAETRVGGDLVSIPRDNTRRASGYFVTEPMIKVEGRIENLKNARLHGTRAEHLIGEIVNRNGGASVVDFGPPAALFRLDLAAGEWITIYGQQMKVNDRPVILAREINKTGVPFQVKRLLVPDEIPPVPTVAEPVAAP